MVSVAAREHSSNKAKSQSFVDTEVGRIPADWNLVTANRVGVFRGGNGFPLSFQGKRSGDYPFFKVSDMNHLGNERTLIAANNYLAEAERLRLGAHVFPARTIVFAKVGAAVFLERKRLLGQPSCIDNNMAGFQITDPEVDVAYIQYYFQSIRLGDMVSTTALPSLSGSVLAAINLPLPPTKREQQAIAAALSDADALIESLENLIAKKRALKQGAMQELLSGRTRLPSFSGSWQSKPIGDVCEVLNGLTYSPSDVRGSGTLVLRSSNIQNDSLSFGDNVFVQMDVPPNTLVKKDDILICVRNGSRELIGKCVRIDERCGGMAFGAFMAVLRTPLHSFILYQFRSDAMKRQIAEHLGATINQITNKSLKSFIVPTPPSQAEAMAVADILSDMDGELDSLIARLSKARKIKQGMMQELLTGRVRLV